MNMKQLTLKLFNFMGSPVNLNLLFLIIFAMVPLSYAISIFIAVLIHEMAHAYVAVKKGYQVYGIEINLFSGAASMYANIHERDSIPITAAGPISNLILYLISVGIVFAFPNIHFINDFALVNLLLFIFNILPIHPMDGGRILKDYLYLKGNRRKAKIISAKISLITSVLLLGVSIFFGYLFMSLFAVYFGYLSLKDLGYIKK